MSARALRRMLYGINYCGQARAAVIPPVMGRVGQVRTSEGLHFGEQREAINRTGMLCVEPLPICCPVSGFAEGFEHKV